MRFGDPVCSPFGTFASSYSVLIPGTIAPRNYLTMPGLVSVNLRVYRTVGFGGHPKNAQGQMPDGMPSAGLMGMAGGGRGRGGPGHGPGGPPMGGPGGMFGGSREHPYNLTLSVTFENLLNHFNPGGYQGVITSPYFLPATSINTGFGGGGPGGPGGGGPGGPGGGSADNRRIQFGLRFSF